MRFNTLLAASGIALASPLLAQGAAINIQFGKGANTPTAPAYTGTGTAALANNGGTAGATDSGTTWNEVGPTGGSAAKASNGATLTSPVTVSVTNNGAYNFPNAAGYTDTTQPRTLLDFFDYNHNTANSTFTITGLAAGTYDLYLYGINGNYKDSRVTTFAVSVNSASQGSKSASNGTTGDTSFVNNSNYVVFPALTVPAGATISGTYTSTGSEADFNGIQIVAAPKPVSAGVVALGSLGLLARWRRRARARPAV